MGAMASLDCDDRRLRKPSRLIRMNLDRCHQWTLERRHLRAHRRRRSGDDAAAAEGVRTVRLNVSHAFHSPLLEPMIDSFLATARSVRLHGTPDDLISNVTGRLIGAEIAKAAYWAEHVRAPVMFSSAVQTLANSGCQIFLEVGPHPTLLGMGADCLADVPVKWLPTLQRGRSDRS